MTKEFYTSLWFVVFKGRQEGGVAGMVSGQHTKNPSKRSVKMEPKNFSCRPQTKILIKRFRMKPVNIGSLGKSKHLNKSKDVCNSQIPYKTLRKQSGPKLITFCWIKSKVHGKLSGNSSIKSSKSTFFLTF